MFFKNYVYFLKIFKPNNKLCKFKLLIKNVFILKLCMYMCVNADVHGNQKHWIPGAGVTDNPVKFQMWMWVLFKSSS